MDRLHEFHCVNRSNNGETKDKQKITSYSAHYKEYCLSILKYSCLLSIPQQFSMTLVLLHLDFQVRSNFKRRPIKSSGREYLEILLWV